LSFFKVTAKRYASWKIRKRDLKAAIGNGVEDCGVNCDIGRFHTLIIAQTDSMIASCIIVCSYKFMRELGEHTVIFVVGPTGSGKTELGLAIAQALDTEVISLDPVAARPGMDVGSAKPTTEEQASVPHRLLDVFPLRIDGSDVGGPHRNAAATLAALARASIDELRGQGMTPVLVGGSPFVYRAVRNGYTFDPLGRGGDSDARLVDLQHMPIAALRSIARPHGLPFRGYDRGSLIYHILRSEQIVDTQPLEGVVTIGLDIGSACLKARIQQRTAAMMPALREEVKGLLATYGQHPELGWAIGYGEFFDYFDGSIDLAEVERLINLHTTELAEWQLREFRRFPEVEWVANSEVALQKVR
jgi:tRNA dimethylallyltransferase